MIDLRLKIEPLPIDQPAVVRLVEGRGECENDAVLLEKASQRRDYDYKGFSLTVYAHEAEPLDGDVLLMFPGQKSAHRLIRAGSPHNTLLVTEQCDQLCVMCSQPPKKFHADLFDHFTVAAQLAPPNSYLGISGGEPLLHKARLWEFLIKLADLRPDLKFHILTNGQHFASEDSVFLREMGPDRILWGIPLYASVPALHDTVVGKSGAFETLRRNFGMLAGSGASVELRTVVLRQNWEALPDLANYVTTRLPFVRQWALMQLENIGYGRKNWDISFQDSSEDFTHLKTALNIAATRGINALLFNFPLCTVPDRYRQFAHATISDWKRKYLPRCAECNKRNDCGGFFEWYITEKGFKGLGAL